ncbi:hypothetical protein [Nocardia sp. NPDC050412]|uniref:hypothetical protein n=1 Tax=Nocardia sp. NPDC050412 TaxID=3364320 RepID=UPI0037B5D503
MSDTAIGTPPSGNAFMSSRVLAHFASILTDGRLIYFADLGLADFDLSAEETDFFRNHSAYDHCYIASHLLRHILLGKQRDRTKYKAFLRDWGAEPPM